MGVICIKCVCMGGRGSLADLSIFSQISNENESKLVNLYRILKLAGWGWGLGEGDPLNSLWSHQ